MPRQSKPRLNVSQSFFNLDQAELALMDKKERHELDLWLRKIMMLNEHDDKADVRDGIAETKGNMRRVNDDFRARLRLVPHE